MAQLSKTNLRILMVMIVTVLSALILVACVSAQPTHVAAPSVSPSATNTNTPEPASATPETSDISLQATDNDKSDIIRPSVTPAPTATPGVITQKVNEFATSLGLHQTTVMGVSVEDLLNLLVSIFIALLVGFLLSRLAYLALERAAAQTETKYDDEFLEIIQNQITAVFIVFGLQFGTLRLTFIDAADKQLVTTNSNCPIIAFLHAGRSDHWQIALIDTKRIHSLMQIRG